jgi:TM2 domain-containing membrane protein YozV
MFCHNCGAQVTEGAAFCTKCGAVAAAQPGPVAPPPGWNSPGVGPSSAPGPIQPPSTAKSKLVAALLGIFVGAFGIHRFYLGYNNIGIAQLVLGVLGILTCGITTIAAAIWGLIEGILILTGSINRDAQGRPLVE